MYPVKARAARRMPAYELPEEMKELEARLRLAQQLDGPCLRVVEAGVGEQRALQLEELAHLVHRRLAAQSKVRRHVERVAHRAVGAGALLEEERRAMPVRAPMPLQRDGVSRGAHLVDQAREEAHL